MSKDKREDDVKKIVKEETEPIGRIDTQTGKKPERLWMWTSRGRIRGCCSKDILG